MNYVVFCNKVEKKSYEEMFKSAANSHLLAAETELSAERIDKIKSEYNPHGVIIAGIEYEVAEAAVKHISENYGDLKAILIFPYIEKNEADELRKYTQTVITRPITVDDFTYIIDNDLGSYEIEVLNGKKPDNVNTGIKSSWFGSFSEKINLKAVLIVTAAIAVFFLLGLLVYSKISPGVERTQPERESVFETEQITEYETESEPETETDTEAAEKQSDAESAASQTEVSDPTEKPTENKTGSSSSPQQVQSSQPSQSQTQQQSQPQQSQQPTQQSQPPAYEVETQEPYTPPDSTDISDDGRIYLDPAAVTLRVGQIYEIYVTGLSAANGCNWSVQNAAVVDFVSGDTTKIIIKAKGIGTTVITATSKSNGTSAQCVVTVKK